MICSIPGASFGLVTCKILSNVSSLQCVIVMLLSLLRVWMVIHRKSSCVSPNGGNHQRVTHLLLFPLLLSYRTSASVVSSIRHAVVTSSSPRLYAYSFVRLVLLKIVFPTVVDTWWFSTLGRVLSGMSNVVYSLRTVSGGSFSSIVLSVCTRRVIGCLSTCSVLHSLGNTAVVSALVLFVLLLVELLSVDIYMNPFVIVSYSSTQYASRCTVPFLSSHSIFGYSSAVIV